MIRGRTALYKGFMIIMHPYPRMGMTAYRNPEYYNNGISSYEAVPGADIITMIDDAGDYGEFTQEQFDELAGTTADVPTVDVCVGCGQEFPAELLMYEGVEPIVFDPRCNVCMTKQMQDKYGAENVILPSTDRQLTPQELKDLRFDINIENRVIDAVEKLHAHFVYEKKNRPYNYNDEQIRTGLTQIYFWEVVEAGESGIGALNVLHAVILRKIDEEVVGKDIYRDFLTHFHYMKERWLDSLLTGGEVDYS